MPRPGLLGLAIRLVLGVAVAYLAFGAITGAPDYWDGFSDPLGAWQIYLVLVLFSSWVLNELLQKSWKFWPTVVLLAGAGVAIAAGATQGDPWGPAFGTYIWVWALAFSFLLAPALLLATVLRTPGCEMRAYADLATRMRGGDPKTVQCPGSLDRMDGVRVFGRW